jgi:hypothetical protein
MSRRIAEFEESDDALRFARMKGADYCVCGGIHFAWAVRPKMAHEIGLGNPAQPAERVNDSATYDGDEA